VFERVKIFSAEPPVATEPKSNVTPSLIAKIAGGAPVPVIARDDASDVTPLLNEISSDDDVAPFAVGANVTTTVHELEAARVAEQLPPVPGYEPPLNVYGAARPPPLIDVAESPPVLLNVNDLSVEEPVARVPKSNVGPSVIVIAAGATPIPVIERDVFCAAAPSL
jgi:hypothetical protein